MDKIRLEPKNPWLYYDLAEEYYQNGYHQAAVAPLEVAISLDPEMVEPHMLLGFVYFELGQQAQGLEKFSYSSAEAANPDTDREIAQFLEYQGLAETALRFYESAVELGPDRADLHYLLGMAYLAAEYYGLARQELERTLQLSTPGEYVFDEAQRVLNESFNF